MWKYVKSLEYPINIKKKDLRMAKFLVTQYGGANGELGAALRYLNQRYTMPDERGRALLTDIGTEELGHVEMICAMIYQLTKDATLDELKAAGLDTNYTEHRKAVYPTDSNGVPFTVTYFATTGDPVADLAEDMAAEEKARATYENLINLTDDPDIIGPLLFLRQREIIHYARFKELYDDYKKKGYGGKQSIAIFLFIFIMHKKLFYIYNMLEGSFICIDLLVIIGECQCMVVIVLLEHNNKV